MANLYLNGLLDRVEVRGEAVSDRAGPLPFHAFPETSTGQSRVGQGPGARIVQGVRLDDVVDVEGATIALKIDIEGHELAALKGAAGLLARNRCLVQAEVFPERQASVDGFLAACGYAPVHAIGPDRYYAPAKG